MIKRDMQDQPNAFPVLDWRQLGETLGRNMHGTQESPTVDVVRDILCARRDWLVGRSDRHHAWQDAFVGDMVRCSSLPCAALVRRA